MEVGCAGPPNYSNIITKNPEYAGTPLEPYLPKCDNNKDWAISRDRLYISKPPSTTKGHPIKIG